LSYNEVFLTEYFIIPKKKAQMNRLTLSIYTCLLLFSNLILSTVCSAQVFSGVGNTWNGGLYTDKLGNKWSRFISGIHNDLYVTADGHVFATATIEEQHQTLAHYWDSNDGSRRANVEIVGQREWNPGAISVALGPNYIYVNRYDGSSVNSIKSYRRDTYGAGDSVNVSNGGGKGSQGGRIFGLAFGNGELYVSDQNTNKIKVFGERLNFLREFNFVRPRKIAVAPDGNLWVIQGGEGNIIWDPARGARIVKVNKSNGQMMDEITDVLMPFDVETSHYNGNLIVADAHASRCHIRVYDNEGKLVSTLGEPMGAGENPGLWSPAKFDFLVGAGQDKNQRFYVIFKNSITIHDDLTPMAGITVRSLEPDGRLRWEGFSNTFIDSADIDPDNENVVYTSSRKFVMDWSKPAGQEWTVAGYTIDRAAYPEDMRIKMDLVTFSQCMRIKGALFTVVTNQWNSAYGLYRKHPTGEIMIPAAVITREVGMTGSPKGSYIWSDGTGGQPFDGRPQAGEYQSFKDLPGSLQWVWFDSRGDMWMGFDFLGADLEQRKFRRYPVQGLDRNGIPIYKQETYTEYSCPDLWKVNMVQYDAAKDILYLSGYYANDSPRYWRAAGAHLYRYDGFLSKPHWNEKSVINFPNQAFNNGAIVCWSATDPYVFLGQRRDKDNQANPIHLYDGRTGAHIKRWTMPNTVGGIDGTWFFGTGYDTPHGLRSFQRSNGVIEIFAEDVSYAKVFNIHFGTGKEKERPHESVKLQLSAGWNLISIPVQPVEPELYKITEGLSEKVEAIFAYDTKASKYESYMRGSTSNDLQELRAGRGYWIYVGESTTLSVTGQQVSMSIDLVEGWNLIGPNSIRPISIKSALQSIEGKYLALYSFESMENRYKGYAPPDLDELTELEPGKGYWIYSTGNLSWSLP
jgi:hypothetical protein